MDSSVGRAEDQNSSSRGFKIRSKSDNPTLLRLKELETLERLVEKVGKIDLHSSDGGGLQALLDGLLPRAGKAV
jgi:hypothetical protein